MNLIDRFLEEHADELALHRYGVRRPIRSLLITPRFPASRHVLGLVPGEQRRAALVVKVPRRPWDVAGVKHEAMVLRRLRQWWSDVGEGVPQIVADRIWNGNRFLVETAVPGFVVSRADFRRRPDRYGRASVDWLNSLPATGRTASDSGSFLELVERPLQRFTQLLEPNAAEHALVARTRHAVEPLATADLPLVFEHGDFSVPNLLWRPDPGRLGVIDWEMAHPTGLPLHDLAFFLAFAASIRARARGHRAEVEAFRGAVLSGDGWARAMMRDSLDRAGVDPHLLGPLLLAARARYAVRLFARLGVESARRDCRSQSSVLALFRSGLDAKLWWATESAAREVRDVANW